jgi:hypothetical protein
MTAAHKKLPFGTIVKVTNKKKYKKRHCKNQRQRAICEGPNN